MPRPPILAVLAVLLVAALLGGTRWRRHDPPVVDPAAAPGLLRDALAELARWRPAAWADVPASADRTLSGTLAVAPARTSAGPRCPGAPGVRYGLEAGVPVEVRDATSGALLALGALVPDPGAGRCAFRFAVAGVPPRARYAIAVAGWGRTEVTAGDLAAAGWRLRLGSPPADGGTGPG